MVAGNMLGDIRHDFKNFIRQGAAIGVAQHHPAGAGFKGCRGTCQRIIAIGFIAVEKMLAIDHGFAPALADGRHAVVNACEIFIIADAQRHIDMIVPAFGNKAHRACLCVEHFHKSGVIVSTATGTLCHAKGRHHGAGKFAIFGKKLAVGRVGTGITALDIIKTQTVESIGNANFIGQRKINAGGLLPVAQGGVE